MIKGMNSTVNSAHIANSVEMRVRISSADFADFSFSGLFESRETGEDSISHDGEHVRYGFPNTRSDIGLMVAYGHRGSSSVDRSMGRKYLGALADLKVLVEGFIALSSPIIELLGKRYLLAVVPGPTFKLMPRARSLPSGVTSEMEVALHLVNDPSTIFLNNASGIDIARMLISYSCFSERFMQGLSANQAGAAHLISMYARITSQARISSSFGSPQNLRVAGQLLDDIDHADSRTTSIAMSH